MATTPAPGIDRVPLYVRDVTTGQWYEVGTPVAHSHTGYVVDTGDTMTGNLAITGASISANNLIGGVVVLADGASVPGGTPNGTLIVRYNTV